MTQVSLVHLNEPSILHVLELRFMRNLIYTYSGRILLSINPFRDLPLYTTDVLEQYVVAGAAAPGSPEAYEALPPHVFAMADWAYQRMVQGRKARGPDKGDGAWGRVRGPGMRKSPHPAPVSPLPFPVIYLSLCLVLCCCRHPACRPAWGCCEQCPHQSKPAGVGRVGRWKDGGHQDCAEVRHVFPVLPSLVALHMAWLPFSTSVCCRYITHVAGGRPGTEVVAGAAAAPGPARPTVAQQVLESNPVLEVRP
jgi:hypothetical protein